MLGFSTPEQCIDAQHFPLQVNKDCSHRGLCASPVRQYSARFTHAQSQASTRHSFNVRCSMLPHHNYGSSTTRSRSRKLTAATQPQPSHPEYSTSSHNTLLTSVISGRDNAAKHVAEALRLPVEVLRSYSKFLVTTYYHHTIYIHFQQPQEASNYAVS